jgi:hypothetical protein
MRKCKFAGGTIAKGCGSRRDKAGAILSLSIASGWCGKAVVLHSEVRKQHRQLARPSNSFGRRWQHNGPVAEFPLPWRPGTFSALPGDRPLVFDISRTGLKLTVAFR